VHRASFVPILQKPRSTKNGLKTSVDLELSERAGYAVHGISGAHAGAAESLFQSRDCTFPRFLRIQLKADSHLVVIQQSRFHCHQLLSPQIYIEAESPTVNLVYHVVSRDNNRIHVIKMDLPIISFMGMVPPYSLGSMLVSILLFMASSRLV